MAGSRFRGARGLRRGALCLLIVAVDALAGCTSTSTSQASTVTVTPASSLSDQPVHIVVSGLAAEQKVTVGLNSTNASGAAWASKAVFQSNRSGTVDLATAPAISGSYSGVNPMGLIEALQPVDHGGSGYYWTGAGIIGRFQVTVTEGGSIVATSTFNRALNAHDVTATSESIAATGFYGQFWKPPAGTAPHPAVLEIGGSEGGLDGQLLGGALASAGYPTLDIAYFGEPGLPSKLQDIPLEYFARALQWLARQPGVLPGETYVAGASRGSEAALLLGVYYPNLVHGVIASSPGDVSLCSYPGCTGPAWTLDGKPLPYTSWDGADDAVNNAAAVIPVQKIHGPLLFDCGTDDNLWASCAHANYSYRLAEGTPYPHVLYSYEGAGHQVNTLVPYAPVAAAAENATGQGDTPLANVEADARLWPQVLSFLADPSGHTGTFTAPATPPSLGP